MTLSRKPFLAPIQSKLAKTPPPRTPPVAPAAYRPQTLPKVLQTKASATSQPNNQTGGRIASPVYRPHLSKFAQPKMAAAQLRATAVTAPVHRPNGSGQLKPTAPPIYRPAHSSLLGPVLMKQSRHPVSVGSPIRPRAAGGRISVILQTPVSSLSHAPNVRVANGSPAVAQRSVIQRALDQNVVTNQQTKSQLSDELKAGLALAQTYPNALAANKVPGWVKTRVIKWIGENGNDIDDEITPPIREAWLKAEFNKWWAKQGQARQPDNTEKQTGRTQVEADALNDPKKTELANYIAAKLPNARTAWKNQEVGRRETELRSQHWAKAFTNNEGLPGTKGAGGYKEYYAEMDQTTSTTSNHKFWGKNRIVHNVSGLTNALLLADATDVQYANKWYASSDHYTTFTLITDA
jgi:hypothetical protein